MPRGTSAESSLIGFPLRWTDEIRPRRDSAMVRPRWPRVENNVLTPKIQGVAVNLSGFFIIVAVTLFGALLGVLGALTAVPLAATIQIFVQELTKARRAKVEAARAALEAPAQPG